MNGDKGTLKSAFYFSPLYMKKNKNKLFTKMKKKLYNEMYNELIIRSDKG